MPGRTWRRGLSSRGWYSLMRNPVRFRDRHARELAANTAPGQADPVNAANQSSSGETPHLHVVGEPARWAPALPAPITSFIGRESDIDTAGTLLRNRSIRLVTLSGPGGIGKTSLAIRIARDLEPEYPDGVWYVSLVSVTDPGQVA